MNRDLEQLSEEHINVRAVVFRVALTLACLAAAILIWMRVWFHPNGRSLMEEIMTFLAAMSATGATIGAPLKYVAIGAVIGFLLGFGWCAYIAFMIATGRHGFA